MMSKLLQTYYRAVQKRPILVQCCMTSSMWMIGDSLAQYLERQNTTNKSKGPKTHNYSRTLKMGLIGLCWNGPFSAWWLRFLDRKLGTATNSATVYKKLFFDQVQLCRRNFCFPLGQPSSHWDKFDPCGPCFDI